MTSRFQTFLSYNTGSCYIRDYGCGVLPYNSLCSIYGNSYFVVFECGERLKVFYFKGSKEKFERRCEDLFNVLNEQCFRISKTCPHLKVWSIGYVPALLTVDITGDGFTDAIRTDFFKYGFKAYETGNNVLGNICNSCSCFNVAEYKRARFLNFDFPKWLMKVRKEIMKKIRKDTDNQ